MGCKAASTKKTRLWIPRTKVLQIRYPDSTERGLQGIIVFKMIRVDATLKGRNNRIWKVVKLVQGSMYLASFQSPVACLLCTPPACTALELPDLMN